MRLHSNIFSKLGSTIMMMRLEEKKAPKFFPQGQDVRAYCRKKSSRTPLGRPLFTNETVTKGNEIITSSNLLDLCTGPFEQSLRCSNVL